MIFAPRLYVYRDLIHCWGKPDPRRLTIYKRYNNLPVIVRIHCMLCPCLILRTPTKIYKHYHDLQIIVRMLCPRLILFCCSVHRMIGGYERNCEYLLVVHAMYFTLFLLLRTF